MFCRAWRFLSFAMHLYRKHSESSARDHRVQSSIVIGRKYFHRCFINTRILRVVSEITFTSKYEKEQEKVFGLACRVRGLACKGCIRQPSENVHETFPIPGGGHVQSSLQTWRQDSDVRNRQRASFPSTDNTPFLRLFQITRLS